MKILLFLCSVIYYLFVKYFKVVEFQPDITSIITLSNFYECNDLLNFLRVSYSCSLNSVM